MLNKEQVFQTVETSVRQILDLTECFGSEVEVYVVT